MGPHPARSHWEWQRPAAPRTIHTGRDFLSLVWLQDGYLAAAGSPGRILLWDTDIPRMKALAHKIAGRLLTPSERSRFRLSGAQ